jgi:hypothetical protein
MAQLNAPRNAVIVDTVLSRSTNARITAILTSASRISKHGPVTPAARRSIGCKSTARASTGAGVGARCRQLNITGHLPRLSWHRGCEVVPRDLVIVVARLGLRRVRRTDWNYRPLQVND